MTKLKLSHSSVSSYQTCARKYYYHYIEKLRPKEQSAALLWGSAIDTALNYLLLDINKQRVDYLGQEYNIHFTNAWRKAWVNKVQTDLQDNETIVYAASDFDGDLISQADLNAVVAKTGLGGIYQGVAPVRTPEEALELVDTIKKLKEAKGWENLTSKERRYYNYMHWLSMHAKGVILIRQYIEQIVPKIKRVLSGQKEITLSNDDGDVITGFVDAVLEWEDGRIIVFDNKTAAREYEWDAVLTSPQLALYVAAVQEEYNTKFAGFIVLRKQIDKQKTKKCSVCGHDGTGGRAKTCDNEVNGKRCGGAWLEKINPKGRIDVLINEISDHVKDIVLENFMDIAYMIKQNVYPRTLSACERPFPCSFRDLCWKNKMEGLFKLEDK
jgi:hypothetical protein